MTIEELLEDLERRASEAETIGATAPVAAVLRSVREQVGSLDHSETPSRRDRLITVQEAADRAGLTPRWFYDNRHTLPFVKKLSSKQLRISERGFDRWLASR